MSSRPDLDDEPPAVEVLNEAGRSSVVLLCEHASAYIPARYGCLGLSQADARRHIAWDLGAADVTRHLSAALDATAFLGTYSRLLIDLNRPPEAGTNTAGVPDSIATMSEDTVIPGNVGIGRAEVADCQARIFDPFHARVAAHLDERARSARPTVIVTVHSFTPVRGHVRPWHCGILFDRSEAVALRLIDHLRTEPALVVEANVPYQISFDADYAIPVHGQARGHDAVLIEIRQDLIEQASGALRWAERLASALAALDSAPGETGPRLPSDR